MNTTLYYIHDPMCSWCYAFNSSLNTLIKHFANKLPIRKITGGLAPDSNTPMPVAMKTYIGQTWHRIENTVPGVHFNHDFWHLNTPIRSTYPACRAVLAAKKIQAASEMPMIEAIQTAYYQLAKNPSLPETLRECALSIGLDEKDFIDTMNSAEIEFELQRDIDFSRSIGANSYPSLYLSYCGTFFPIAVDYTTPQTMIKAIYSIINSDS